MTKTHELSVLFNPSSVVMIGASSDPEKLTGRPLDILRRHDYSGRIFVINPRREQVGGVKAYKDLASLPEVPEVALIMLPSEAVPGSIAACGEAGVKFAVILSSGFEEVAGAEAITAALREVMDRTGIRVVGPNSEGLWAVPNRFIFTFGSAARRDVITTGPVSVLSQSGSIGGGILRNLERRGLGCRYFVSLGNETSLTSMDYIDFLIDEGGTKVILLFIEGLKEGERLLGLAARAQERGVQIVMLRGGKSDAGREATASHTGKIATASAVYNSVLRQCGVIQVESIAGLVDAAEVFTVAPPIVRGGEAAGIGVMGISGGSRSLVADACDQLNVPLAVFTPETEAATTEIVPSYGYAKNPTDVTGQVLSDPTMFSRAIAVIVADPNVEAMLVQYANRGPEQIYEDIENLSLATSSTGKPVMVSFLGEEIDHELRSTLLSHKILVASGPDVAVRYLSWLYQAAHLTGRSSRRDSVPTGSASSDLTRDALLRWDGQVGFLESCGVSVPAWQVVPADLAVEQLVSTVPFPVVVKAMPEDVAHKTELGLVRLNISDETELRESVTEMRVKAGAGTRLLIQEMVEDGFEVVVTLRDDPDFGPVVAVGAGGTMVELLNEMTHIAIPCPGSDIAEALAGTRLTELLGGFRGSAPRDVAALRAAIAGLASGYLALRDRPSEIEINPLLVKPVGGGTSAVDILVL